MIKFWYRSHETGAKPRMRVWKDGWPSDSFEVLSHADFQNLKGDIAFFNESLSRKNLGEPVALLHYTKED